jgi:protein-disulfide isomerase
MDERDEEEKKENYEEKKIDSEEKKEANYSKENTNSNKSQRYTESLRKNPWIVSTLALGILSLILFTGNSGMTGEVISEDKIEEITMNFISSMTDDAEFLKAESYNDYIYEVALSYQENEILLYITKDGKYLIQGLTPLGEFEEELDNSEEESESIPQEIPKSEKPEVELFIMSYCPYGVQAEKGIIPVLELLKDKVDFRMRYVSYLMHGEKEAEENLREYCIQEIASDKYIEYMNCYLEGDGVESNGYIMNGNDIDKCLTQAGIDKEELETCMSETDEEFSITDNLNSGETYPKFNIDAELNKQYGVQGSPSLVINGILLEVSKEGNYEFNEEKIAYSRSPETYKKIICSLFSEIPEECNTELSSETPSPYFGWESSGTTTTAQC